LPIIVPLDANTVAAATAVDAPLVQMHTDVETLRFVRERRDARTAEEDGGPARTFGRPARPLFATPGIPAGPIPAPRLHACDSTREPR
jgi:hypothetical protein